MQGQVSVNHDEGAPGLAVFETWVMLGARRDLHANLLRREHPGLENRRSLVVFRLSTSCKVTAQTGCIIQHRPLIEKAEVHSRDLSLCFLRSGLPLLLPFDGNLRADDMESSGGGGSYSAGQGHWESHTETSTHEYTPLEASSSGIAQDSTLRQNGQYYYTTSTNTFSTYTPAAPTYSGPGVTLIPKTANCTQPVLSSPAAKDTTLGLRMRGTYEGFNGLSVEFYPDSALVGCGKVARAYPYIVRANGREAGIEIKDPAHPLWLAIKADAELDPGQGRYEVHGRSITGSNGHGGLTFAPLSATCNLETLAAANAAPLPARASSASTSPMMAGGAASTPSNSAASSPANPPSRTTTAGGNAILLISSGLQAQPGGPNPLANHPYVLLRDKIASIMARAGVQVPAGESPYKVLGNACGNHTPDCQKILAAVNADAASAARADVSGKAAMPPVPPGTYYLMISAQYNNQALVWDMPVQLKTGNNSLTLSQTNAAVVK